MMESSDRELEGMSEEELIRVPIDKRRRDDIKKEEESFGKGFKKALLDIDESKVNVAPEESWLIGECFPARFLFCWFFPLVCRGFWKSTTMQDLPKVVSHAECEYMEKKFDYIWPKLQGLPLRFLLAMNYCFGIEFWLAGALQIITTTCQVFVPKLMQLFLEQLYKPYDKDVPDMLDSMEQLRQILPSSHDIYPPSDDEITRSNNWEAWLYLGLLVFCYWIASWGLQYSFHLSARVGMKVRTIVVTKVYQKSLRLSNKARGKYENGVIMNHVTTDAVKFERVHTLMHYGWTGWLLLGGSIPFLVDLIDWGALFGILTNLIIIPICVVVISIFVMLRICIVKVTDTRVNKTNEVLQSIRIVKFFAWEESFVKRILGYRLAEVTLLRMTFSLFSILISFFLTLTNIVCFVAFLTYFMNHGHLDSIKIFTALTYFNTMRAPLTIAPMILIMVLEMSISLERIGKLLEEDELEELEISENEEYPIIIEGGTFRWETTKKKKGVETRSRKEIQKERMQKIIKRVCCCACAPCFSKNIEGNFALPAITYSDDENEKSDDEKEEEEIKIEGEITLQKRIMLIVQILRKKMKNMKKKKKEKKKKKKDELNKSEEGVVVEGEDEEDKKVNLGALEDINLRVKKGSLTMIIGKVGSGKSSLLYAILGEMKRYEGSLSVTGNFAFTQQLSWIQNATLYDNVTFGEEKDEDRWDEIVRCCQLQQDLDELKGGRNIEIGEKGINLSGGQKYRVSLARACYSPRNVVLLDDPLAAVDAHVGKRIFYECIMGFLKERTRVLVTHQLQYLEHADWVILMSEGKILEQGKYNDLMRKNGEMASLVSEYNASLEEEEDIDIDIDTSSDDASDDDEESEESELTTTEQEIESEDKKKKKKKEEEEEGGENIEIIIKDNTSEEDSDDENTEKGSDDDEDDDNDSMDEIIQRSIEESTKHGNLRKRKAEKQRKKNQRLRRRNKANNVEEENKIISHEEMSSGIISPKVVLTYIYNMGCCGIVPIICIFIVFLCAQLVTTGTDWWLSEWSSGSFNEAFSKDFHMYVHISGFGSDGKPKMTYLDYDEYSLNVPPVVDTNMTLYKSLNLTYPPILNGTVNCTLFMLRQQQNQQSSSETTPSFTSNLNFGSNPIKKVPKDYTCPSVIGWCGCFDFYLPVMWKSGWDNGTQTEDGLRQIDSLYVYAGFGFSSLFFMFLRTIVAMNFLITAAHTLHNKALKRVLKAPMSFFDTTPIGRIVARFSTDTTLLDSELITSVMPSMSMSFAVSGMFFIICYNTDGWGAMFVAPLGIVYFIFYIIYRKTNMELKRLESVSKTPMLSHISETLNGMPTIRAYQAKPRFISRVRTLIDRNNRAFYMLASAQRWLGVYLGIFGSSFLFCIGCFLILIYYYWDAIEFDISYTALAMSYAILSTQIFFMVVDNICEAEVKMNSVERINFYCKNIPIESPFERDLRKPKNYIKKGEIEFKNYSMRYRKGLELVLKDLNFKISSFERIGIVGRTGSGKSSLMIALWRIVEAARGRIIIDGHPIDEINLLQLRNSLSIIPQDATLFSGTVRSNLDPFQQYKDKEIWLALKQSFMYHKVKSLRKKLGSEIKEGGSNFSVGERQLFCLARALLRNTKILVLDEATASVDINTDAKIQRTIRESFGKGCTSLIIAHRLETIIDCDKILVMDDGRAAEFDSPKNLLADTENYNIFRDLVHETGEMTEKFLYDVAFGRKKLEYEVEVDDDITKEKEKKDKKEEETEGESVEEENLSDDDDDEKDDDDDEYDDESASGDTEDDNESDE